MEDTRKPGKKWRPLEKMFNEVPERYDLLNRIITVGLDERWRKMAVSECLSGIPVNSAKPREPGESGESGKSCPSQKPPEILDLCTGTGDLVLRMARNINGSANIKALDYSVPMLRVARRKAGKMGLDKIEFIQGDAADLPFSEGSLDVIGIGFAFRNLTYKNPDQQKFLYEILRVLDTGGKFVIIESSQPENPALKALFRLYLKVMVAGLGGMIAGHRGAYRYLAASARNFYTPAELKNMLLESGFSRVEHRSLSGGVAGLTIAIK